MQHRLAESFEKCGIPRTMFRVFPTRIFPPRTRFRILSRTPYPSVLHIIYPPHYPPDSASRLSTALSRYSALSTGFCKPMQCKMPPDCLKAVRDADCFTNNSTRGGAGEGNKTKKTPQTQYVGTGRTGCFRPPDISGKSPGRMIQEVRGPFVIAHITFRVPPDMDKEFHFHCPRVV